MYLAQSSRSDIAYAVHQCTRFTHAPKKSHVAGVKRILRYLQGTKGKGLILNPTTNHQVDCYVDADFAGLWHVKQDQNSFCVKSRTVYMITFMGSPLIWASRIQTQIALSTMEIDCFITINERTNYNPGSTERTANFCNCCKTKSSRV